MTEEQLIANGLAIILAYALVGIVLLGFGIVVARASWQKYEYRVFLNEVNFLHVGSVLSAATSFALSVGDAHNTNEAYVIAAFGAALLLPIIAWAINISRTSTLMGTIITVVQLGSLLYLILWALLRGWSRSVNRYQGHDY